MSCEDFDAFVAEFGDQCTICGRAGRETGHGFLNIDHDPRVGRWAVRGRLCASCNARISVDRATTPEDAAYLANPWYQRRFAALGISWIPGPEPGLGTVVAVQKKRSQRWKRTEHGWERMSKHAGGTATWRDLNYHYGPHRIRVVRGQLALL